MKVETYKIKGWKDQMMGVIIKESKEWLLVQEIEGDYHVDGYTLLRKSFIKKRRCKQWEKQVALVLDLHKHKPELKGFRFAKLPTMLKWIEKHHGIFSFQDKVEESIEIGKVEDVVDNVLGLNFLLANGQFVDKHVYEYNMDKIRKVSFDTHYLNSLKLLNAHHKKK